MSHTSKDSSTEGGHKRPVDEEPPEDRGENSKRSRGPSDCLDWDEYDDEDEVFTPYTQSNPEVVYPSAVKLSGKKLKCKNGKGKKSISKGKCSGNLLFGLCNFK